MIVDNEYSESEMDDPPVRKDAPNNNPSDDDELADDAKDMERPLLLLPPPLIMDTLLPDRERVIILQVLVIWRRLAEEYLGK